MKGKILDFTFQNGGLIAAEDGSRYNFAVTEWKDKTFPERGQRVDFTIRDGVAAEVFAELGTEQGLIKNPPLKKIPLLTQGRNAVWKKYASFSGRASRREFWGSMLFVFLTTLATEVLVILTKGEDKVEMAVYVCTLIYFLPCIAVTARRLHDIGKPGWWQFATAIPVVGIVLLIMWGCTEGEQGENKYGHKPEQ